MAMNDKKRELLFSVTQRDCDWQATKGSGPGGQHRNKVSTAIRCTHRASGAVGFAADDKSQHKNKRRAFRRMVESDIFQKWVRLEASRRTGETAEIEARVKKMMDPENIKCEVHDERGHWTTAPVGGDMR